MFRWIGQPKGMISIPLLLVLLFTIACGAAATATPAPAAKAPAATTAPVAVAPTATPVPKAAATPTPAPTIPAKPKVTRLILSLTTPPHETNRPWLTSGSGLVQHNPMFDTLIGVDVKTGEYKPTMLATKWQMSPDGKAWTFWLREGIPFHFGFGNFTARDVEHGMKRMTAKEAIQTNTPFYRKLLGPFQIVDDQQIVFNLTRPELTMDHLISEWRQEPMMSKAQWDKEGDDGMEKRPAGTGPYRFKERQLGAFTRYERVENHWRKTPDFAELQLNWVPEAATRLATLLAKEVQIADIPTDLEKQAHARGMKTINSTFPGIMTYIGLGGQYYSTPEKFDPNVPWTKREVREALNRAINRKELNATIFGGRGTPMLVTGFHPAVSVTNPEWEKQFEAKYGYDPAKAKKLLTEAGYPNGFKIKMYSFLLSGFPELPDTVDALALYWKAIGLDVTIESLEFARVRDLYQGRAIHQNIFPFRLSLRPAEDRLRINLTVTLFHEDKFMLEKLDKLENSLDLAERNRLLLEMGDHLYNGYFMLPLFFVPVGVVVNPEVVAEWAWPGVFNGTYTHMEYIKAAK
jgi:ABC-type transport system substrate-binding protein